MARFHLLGQLIDENPLNSPLNYHWAFDPLLFPNAPIYLFICVLPLSPFTTA